MCRRRKRDWPTRHEFLPKKLAAHRAAHDSAIRRKRSHPLSSFRLLPGKQVWKALGLLPARLWVLVLVGYLAAHIVGAMKYELVLNLGGAGIRWRQAARCYFAGLFGSLFCHR